MCSICIRVAVQFGINCMNKVCDFTRWILTKGVVPAMSSLKFFCRFSNSCVVNAYQCVCVCVCVFVGCCLATKSLKLDYTKWNGQR